MIRVNWNHQGLKILGELIETLQNGKINKNKRDFGFVRMCVRERERRGGSGDEGLFYYYFNFFLSVCLRFFFPFYFFLVGFK